MQIFYKINDSLTDDLQCCVNTQFHWCQNPSLICAETRLLKGANVCLCQVVLLHGRQKISGSSVEPSPALGKHALEESHVAAILKPDVCRQRVVLKGVNKVHCGLYNQYITN